MERRIWLSNFAFSFGSRGGLVSVVESEVDIEFVVASEEEFPLLSWMKEVWASAARATLRFSV